jgi:hypothetical protein
MLRAGELKKTNGLKKIMEAASRAGIRQTPRPLAVTPYGTSQAITAQCCRLQQSKSCQGKLSSRN